MSQTDHQRQRWPQCNVCDRAQYISYSEQNHRTGCDIISPYLGSTRKRLTELIIVLALLPLVLPTVLLIAIVILVVDGRPVFFTQRRVGINGDHFTILKFRTLKRGGISEGFVTECELQLLHTRTGAFLRRHSLDELPQLLMVFTGVMSLVGPRPERVEIVDEYTPNHRRRLLCKPGVTGLWQVLAPRAYPIHEQMKYDLYYLRRASLWLDMRIAFLTVIAVLVPRRLVKA